MRTVLVSTAVLLGGLWLLVWWAQPRMAFFPSRGVQETPASANIPFEDLRIQTADGETLHGWWLGHAGARAQVVYWHGNGGNLSLWLDVLADIHRHGFDVLAVDYRGYGASTGSPTEAGVYRDADAVTAYFEARLRRKHLATIYWGRSLGCAVATYAATKASPDAIILDSPFPDVRSLLAGNPLMLALSVFSTYRFPTSRHLEGYRGPLLVMHGDADTVIPFSAGRAVFERAPTPHKTFAVLNGVDHNDLHSDHPAFWPAVDALLKRLQR